MWMNELLRLRLLRAPEDGAGGGEAAATEPAAQGGEAAAPAGTEGDAGTEDGFTPVIGGKPGEKKPDETAAEDGAAQTEGEGEKPAEADPDDVVPEDGKYRFEGLPDGVAVDEKVAGEVSAIFKDAGLTQKQAGQVATKYAELYQQQVKAQADETSRTLKAWVEEAKADTEIGGSQWDASVAAANRALEKFGTAELDAALSASGLSNHPEMIRMFARVGNAFADDKFTPGAATGDTRPVEERMYGGTTPSGKGA